MHHAAWLMAPLVLVGVLGFSAATKVGRGESLRSIVLNLALPGWLLPPWLARAIPGIEIALAAGLLTPWRGVFTAAAAGALVLMAVYWLLIARGLSLRPRPSCGCFGQVGDQSITARTLLRNTLLLGAAGATVALAGSGRTVWSALADGGSGAWLWLGLAALACAVTALVVGRPQSGSGHPTPSGESADLPTSTPRPDDEEVEDYVRVPTPELALHDPSAGRPVTLLELSDKRAQLLVFVNCYCMSTKEAMADIEPWHDRLDLVDVRMVFSVPIAERFVGPPPPRTLLDHRALAWQALGLTASPSAVLLGVDGHLAGGPVGGSEEVRTFVDDVAETLSDSLPDAVDPVEDPSGEEESESVGNGQAVKDQQLTGDR